MNAVSASKRKQWTRFLKRDKLQGGEGGSAKRTRSDNVASLLGRLRRLEVVMLVLSGHPRYVRLLTDEELDSLLKNVYDLHQDVGSEATGGRRTSSAERVPLPHQGAVDREGEATSGNDR